MSTMQRVLLMTALALYAGLVFVLDVITPLGIDVWVLNVPVVLVPVLVRDHRMVVFLSLACTAMLVVGWVVPSAGPMPPLWDMLNRGMGLATLWLIAVMAIMIIKKSTQLERDAVQREVLAIAAREQRQIGQELHDGVGQELTGLGLMAQSLAQRLPDGAAEKRVALRLIAGLDGVHQQVREISRGLIPVHVVDSHSQGRPRHGHPGQPSGKPPSGAWFWDAEIFDFVADHLHLIGQHSLRTYAHAWELKQRR